MLNMNKKIVLVDDEPMILKSLKRELEPWSNDNDIEIITYESANEALIYLSENSTLVFLVISDLRMPEIKGSKFLIIINNLYPQIKLFLLTAHSDISDIQEAITASIDRLILKPWSYNNLLSDIENALKLYNIEEQNRLLKDEIQYNISMASQFQKMLLPSSTIIPGAIDIDMINSPVSSIQCGGDFYDFYNIDDNRKIILLGDVSGHGIKPAFVTAMLKVLCSMFRPSIYTKEISPKEIISYINRGLFNSLGEIKDILVTFSAVYIDQKKKIIEVAGAGQLPLYILRNDSLISIKDDNIVMGFIHDSEYTNITQILEKDDLIIMFTDGLIESEKSKMIINKERIEELLLTLNLKNKPAKTIYESFKQFQKNRIFADDVTLITARII